jgi:hypothetical protein
MQQQWLLHNELLEMWASSLVQAGNGHMYSWVACWFHGLQCCMRLKMLCMPATEKTGGVAMQLNVSHTEQRPCRSSQQQMACW